MTDAVVRLLPGAMGDETSALTDSFQDNLLARLYIRVLLNLTGGGFRKSCYPVIMP